MARQLERHSLRKRESMGTTTAGNKLIILDRDGVLNPVDEGGVVKSADAWQPIVGSMDAVALLTQAGYTVVVAANQSGLGRGLLSMQDVNDIHSKMHQQVQKAGGRIDGIWFCPHTAADGCDCRKPLPGMVSDILSRFNAEAADTWLVGDSLRDLQAIAAVGGKPALVLTGKGKKTLVAEGDSLPENTQVFDSLLAFSQYLLQNHAEAI